METKKILLIIPGVDGVGGVASYYKSLLPHLQTPTAIVTRGTNRINLSLCKRILAAVLSYWYVLKELLKGGVGVVQVNTSLDRSGVLRDAFFIVLAWVFRVPVVTFIRGWHPSEVARVEKSRLNCFRIFFLRSTLMIVLSNQVAAVIRRWGFRGTVQVETTTVDEGLLGDDRNGSPSGGSRKARVRLLFLSRIEKEKGIYEAIEAFRILRRRHGEAVELWIAGSGGELENIRTEAMGAESGSITVLGNVSGLEKARVFRESDIYLFPSYHEGMPNAVLEAMALGLPVITTAVGGLCDFFKDGKMGHMIDEPDPVLMADKVEILIQEREERQKIGDFNAKYAEKYFRAKTVAMRMERVWENVMRGTIEDGGKVFWGDSRELSLLDVEKNKTAGPVVRDDGQ